MILRLAWAELRNRPGRAALLFCGYALGVAVMVVLLAVGEAMLEQSRDRALIGGGDLVLVPAGVSADMLRGGGVSSMYLGVDHARFLQRQLLESPRARREHGVVAASPLLAAEPMEIELGTRRVTAIATGEIPSRARAAGAAVRLLRGSWTDSDADRRYLRPTGPELAAEIDHFHRPTGDAARDSTWAEWHYFNVVLDSTRWLYLTFSVGGRVGEPGRWGGRILATTRTADGVHRSRSRDFPGEVVRFDTASAALRMGAEDGVAVDAGGGYRVRATVPGARVDLRVVPSAGRYFPPTDLGGAALVSGYVAPALHAAASGTVCLPECESVRGGAAYHDHNWGVWRGVSWEWGSASDEALSLLYGVVRSGGEDGGMFAYLVDADGVRGVYRPGPIRVLQIQTAESAGNRLRVPRRYRFEDAGAGLAVEVDVRAVHLTDLGRAERRYFVQMRGVAEVREHGRLIGTLPGFFETYVD